MVKLFQFAIVFIAFLISVSSAEDSLKISQIQIHSKDVFEDAKVNEVFGFEIERDLYSFGNWLHVNTRESIVRGRLPFGAGSTVSQEEIQEAEKNLKALPYISDAKIYTWQETPGETDLFVETSDNWSFSPAVSVRKPGEEWLWSLGLLENNLLGLGHTVGFFYEHLEDISQKYLLYESDDFIIPYHFFKFMWSEDEDRISKSSGFSRSFGFGYPFISRSKNQWAYNAELLWSKRDDKFYESENPEPKPIRVINGVREDSASLWFLRSFGGFSFKTYLGLGYDFHRIKNPDNPHSDSEDDSRLGFSLAASRKKLEKKYNLRVVKWADDVERGYYIKSSIAKNFKGLNADNDDWHFRQNIDLSFGTEMHNFLATGQNTFYYNEKDIRDMHSALFAEYIFQPSLAWSSVLSAQVDSWQKTTYERQLYLDGNTIFPGFPAHYLAGDNTFAFKAEQRYIPDFEVLTLIPSFAAFITAGQATDDLRAFEPRDLFYMAGVGIRVSKSKFVQGVVNHLNFSWPLNGELSKGFAPRVSLVSKYEL